jgi:hypothetical protein
MKTLSLLLLCTLLASCARTRISRRVLTQSDPAAVRILEKCQTHHGAASLARLHTVTVSYDGQWGKLVPKVQPVIVDEQFRGKSTEVLDLKKQTIRQLYTGAGGQKLVERTPADVRVSYNGVPNATQPVREASAMVANAYQLFLLGPLFFREKNCLFAYEGTDSIDGAACHSILAIIRPGFGFSTEDRVLLSIDQKTNELRRVRMTLEGVATTKGAEVDTTYLTYRRQSGVLWPTNLVERVRAPLAIHAHRWWVTDLKLN